MSASFLALVVVALVVLAGGYMLGLSMLSMFEIASKRRGRKDG